MRTLKCSDQAVVWDQTSTSLGRSRQIASSVFRDIAFLRPTDEPFLPNLDELHWTAHSSDSILGALLLVSPTLKVLTLSIVPGVAPSAYRGLFRHLSGRLSGVRDLTIATDLTVITVNTELAACLRTMSSLNYLTLPRFYLSGDVLRAASQLSALTSIVSSWSDKHMYDENGMKFPFEKGWFENIARLQIDAHPQPFAAFLSASSYPNLTSIGYSTRRLADAADLHDLCKAIASSCPAVEALSFNLFSNRGELSQARAISFANLRPLLGCAKLETLSVGHDYPMTLHDSDFDEMGGSWTSIENLDFCSDPFTANVSTDTSGTPLSALLTIARAMPRIRRLGLYFSTGSVPKYDEDEVVEWVELSMLESLDVGLSAVSEEKCEDIAFFLGKVCPGATINPEGSFWRDAVVAADANEETELARRHESWREVHALMQMFVRFERDARRKLEQATKRISVLMEESKVMKARNEELDIAERLQSAKVQSL